MSREEPAAPEATATTPRTARETFVHVAALAFIVGAAVFVRAVHLRDGLPDLLEEALPLRWALDMLDQRTLRPAHFNYPSLGLYLHMAAQLIADLVGRARGLWENAADYRVLFHLDPTAHVIAARTVSLLAGVATAIAALRIADRLAPGGGTFAALMVALSGALLHASVEIYVDPIMTAFVAWSFERWLAWDERDDHTWIAAAALTGLAVSAKYPALVMLVPIAWLVFSRRRPRGMETLLMACGVAFVAFVLTTPYALLEPRQLLADLTYERQHAEGGHLGSVGRTAAAWVLRTSFQSLGWTAMAVALLAPIAAWAHPARRGVLAAVLAMLAFALPVAFSRIEAERYLQPVVFFALIAATWVVRWAELRWPRRWPPLVANLLVFGGVVMAPNQRFESDSRVDARRWCEQHVPRSALVIAENYGPALATENMRDVVRREPAFAKASPAVRRRVEERPTWPVVVMPLEVAGRLDVKGEDGESPIAAWDDLTRLTNAYYEPRLWASADWVITSSAVRSRLMADTVRYATAAKLYRLLDQHAWVEKRFRSHGADPEIVVYRITDDVRGAFGDPSTLEPWWWTDTVTPAFRREADARMQPPVPDPGAGAALLDDSPRPWVRAIAPVFHGRVRPVLMALAVELGTLGRPESALAYTLPALWIAPGDREMAAIGAHAAREAGLAGVGRDLIERAVAEGGDPPDAKLTLEYAACLGALGQRERAEALVASLGPQGRAALDEMVRRSGAAK